MKLEPGQRARWFRVRVKASLAERIPVIIVRRLSPLSVLVRREDDGSEHKVRAENLMALNPVELREPSVI